MMNNAARALASSAAIVVKLECSDGHDLVAMKGGANRSVEDFIGSHSTGKFVEYEFTCPSCDKKAWLRLKDRTEEFEQAAEHQGPWIAFKTDKEIEVDFANGKLGEAYRANPNHML